MINFLNGHEELVAHVLSFLEPVEIAKSRLVNQRFKAIIDSRPIYSENVREIKAIYDAMAARESELIAQESRLIVQKSELNDVETKLIIKYKKLVKIIEGSLISKLIVPYVSGYNDVKDEILKLQSQRNHLKNSVKTDQSKQNHLKQTYQQAKTKREYARNVKHADDKIMSLFGGKEKFEALPVLDLDDYEGGELTFDITPVISDIKYPIMRGHDKDGCEFFTIRVTREGSEPDQKLYQIFTQIKGHPNFKWRCGGSFIIDGPGLTPVSIFDSSEQYWLNALAELISKGTVTQEYGKFTLA